MRILFVYPVFPWPLNTGTRVRVYNLLKQAKALGHEVGLISFYDGSGDPGPGAAELLSWLSDLRIVRIGVPHSRWWKMKRLFRVLPLLAAGVPPAAAFCSHFEIRAALDELADQYDAVVVGFYFMGFNVSPRRMAKSPGKFSLIEDDISFIPLARRAEVSPWPAKALHLFRYHGGRKAETRMLLRFARVFTMSETDARLVREIAPGTKVLLSPNGVDCSAIPFRGRPEKASGPLSLLFVGGLAHYPNLDALHFFIGDYWQEIRRRLPGTTLTVVGDPGHVDRSPLEAEGVRFAGFVPDTAEYYAGCDATVTPYRIGGGTRLKILEAMAAGLPVVSTAVGIEGIPAEPGRDYLLAESCDDFVAALERLLLEPSLSSRLAVHARGFVESRFDWPIIVQSLIRDIGPEQV